MLTTQQYVKFTSIKFKHTLIGLRNEINIRKKQDTNIIL